MEENYSEKENRGVKDLMQSWPLTELVLYSS